MLYSNKPSFINTKHSNILSRVIGDPFSRFAAPYDSFRVNIFGSPLCIILLKLRYLTGCSQKDPCRGIHAKSAYLPACVFFKGRDRVYARVALYPPSFLSFLTFPPPFPPHSLLPTSLESSTVIIPLSLRPRCSRSFFGWCFWLRWSLECSDSHRLSR